MPISIPIFLSRYFPCPKKQLISIQPSTTEVELQAARGEIVRLSGLLGWMGVMGCSASEATGLGFVCFVHPRVLLVNRFVLFFISLIFRFYPPPLGLGF